ncbi:MAG: hypothetical protein KC474_06370 [Cyanobacteria bacterium HKST-UBA04]|nr:hypothetical protein [Cyanobacteria bacterium HKST-UBA04]MCA9841982.1 hypothetical protein [Cyanobacteria bacterium HKST-UBA03]
MFRWLLLILVLALIITLPLTTWHLKENVTIRAVLVDKTVPDPRFREHKPVTWILNNQKLINKDTGQPFDFEEDYYGFYPLPDDEYEIRSFAPLEYDKYDLIYFVDTYGVYYKEFYEQNPRGDRSPYIYGGTQPYEVEEVKKVLNKDNVFIAEFNSLATPTEKEAREAMEALLGIKWTGWIGRYFNELDYDANPELPTWVKENWEKQHENEEWLYEGPGYVLVDLSDTIVVLQQPEDIGNDVIRINFSDELAKAYGVSNNEKYMYWFDIVQADKGTEVVANYILDLTAEGQALLDEYQIPHTFPAITRTRAPYNTYYLAGDFSDHQSIPEFYKANFLNIFYPLVLVEREGMQKRFFWKVYFPVMQKILGDLRDHKVKESA